MQKIRKKLKQYKILREPYNHLVELIRYAFEYYKYFLLNIKYALLIRKKKIREILVIRTFGIGDVIRTTAILPKLKRKYPNAKISYFTLQSSLPILENNPYISRLFTEKDLAVVTYQNYDLVINWQIFDNCEYTRKLMRNLNAKIILGRHFNKKGDYNFNTQLRLRTWMEFFCKIALVPYDKDDPEKIKIYLSDYKEKEDYLFNRFNLDKTEKYVGICLGGNDTGEYWYRNFSIDFLSALIEVLAKEYKIILVGRSRDRNREDQEKIKRLRHQNLINLIDKLNLEDLILVIKNFACFISTDTGPLYIALALKVPTVALFSNNSGSRYVSGKKRGRYYTLIYNDRLNCFPCEQIFENKCLRERRARCIEEIPIVDIVKEVKKCFTIQR